LAKTLGCDTLLARFPDSFSILKDLQQHCSNVSNGDIIFLLMDVLSGQL
jgi:hypothetical protein